MRGCHKIGSINYGFNQHIGWAYQDFSTPGSVNITLSANDNGTNTPFEATRIISSTAVIVRADDPDSFAYSGAIKLFSTKISVSSHTSTSVTLNAIPHASWGDVRVYYLYYYGVFPEDYTIAPSFIRDTNIVELDNLFVTEEELTSLVAGSFLKLDCSNDPLTSNLEITGNITTDSFITNGGAASDFVKGDGSLDGSTYLTDITGESIFDLSDFPADPDADKYLKWDDVAGTLIWADALSFGADNQIPYTNATTDGFDFSSIFTFDGTDIKLKQDNSKMYFGDNDDYSIYYTGSNLVLKEEVAGDVVVLAGGLGVGASTGGREFRVYRPDDNIEAEFDSGLATGRSAFYLSNDQDDRAGFFFYGSAVTNGYAEDFRIHLDNAAAQCHFTGGSEIVSALDFTFADDDIKLYLGAGKDASITFDGSDVIFNSDENASGSSLKIEGDIIVEDAATFSAEIDNGNSGAAKTIDWGAGNKQKLTLTGNCTLTFTSPKGPGNFMIRLTQDVTGSRTVTWPATVKWVGGGVAPTLTTTPTTGTDIITFLWNGTNYFGAPSLDFV